MTLRTLIRRSLRFHWRSHLGVVIGAAIGSAALTGALVVGDSVKGSLRAKALERVGPVHFALTPHDRLFRDELGHGLRWGRSDAPWQVNSNVVADFVERQPVSMLTLPGVASSATGEGRANRITVHGVCLYVKGERDGKWLGELEHIPEGEVWLNALLAAQLRVATGDEVLLRVSKAGGLSSEATLTSRTDVSRTFRLRLTRVLHPDEMGNFDLRPQRPPIMNAFVNLRELQRGLALEDRANQLLLSSTWKYEWRWGFGSASWWYSTRYQTASRCPPWLGRLIRPGSSQVVGRAILELESDLVLPFAQRLLADLWKLEDTEAELRTAGDLQHLDLVSRRIFLDPPIERAALAADTNAQPILTYIANLITSGTNATPYSMVTAAGAPWTPTNLGNDEIVLNQWLADDLQATPGDAVALVYYDPESGARLTERTNTFRIHSVVPMEMPWADRSLMPDFPGIEKAESTADWDTAFPLTYKIRPKDDEYWREHRGTPKAFITLAAGKKMWANRFGEVTRIRFPVPGGIAGTPSTASQAGENGDAVKRVPTDAYREALEQKILSNLDPAELGLRFEPVREQALKAAAESQDFGGLFIGFSLFLIAAALILMALLFQFGVEQRAVEVGTLLALGFTRKQVRRLLLGEGATLAFVGGVIGAIGGVLYAKLMLLGLSTVWRDAVGENSLWFFVTPLSLMIGLVASTVVALITIWLALRKQARQPAIRLLNADCGLWAEESVLPTSRRQIQSKGTSKDPVQSELPAGRRQHVWNGATTGFASLALAAGLVGWALAAGETANAGVFFGAGALVLLGGLALVVWRLQSSAGVPPASGEVSLSPGRRAPPATLTTASLAFRGLARRRSRSVATMALLACGSFLILSIGVFRLDANRDAARLTSGTGGFALIGEATLPVVQDLNTASGRDAFALEAQDLPGVRFVQFRVRAGDEASCLNLNRAQKPRLLGVDPGSLQGRFTFAKVATGLDADDGWQLLKSETRNPKSEIEVVPAIGDANSIQWAMGRKVGDTIDYVDDRGRPFKVRIVGAVANSILQGNLIIDEAEFVKRFPNESGYQYFLIEAPTNHFTQVSATLSRALQDHGLEVTPAVQRLNQFNAVQNTYLGTFQILGGLGLLLGSAGLGIVVLRNVLERRGELAVLMAVGFRKRRIGQLVLGEHGALLGLGLAIGLVAAAVAVLPTLLAPGAQLPYATLVPTLIAVLLNGLLWTWLSTRAALRGNLLAALRND